MWSDCSELYKKLQNIIVYGAFGPHGSGTSLIYVECRPNFGVKSLGKLIRTKHRGYPAKRALSAMRKHGG